MRRSDLQRDVRTLERIADLGQQLYIGRTMSQMIDNGHLVFAAQMARDSVSLEKGLQTLNKLAESTLCLSSGAAAADLTVTTKFYPEI